MFIVLGCYVQRDLGGCDNVFRKQHDQELCCFIKKCNEAIRVYKL